ncbi:hypothetical protein NQ318_000300 [Aromia moschata]|uniref:Uncharacterized protein n=1 Tax=Aromia moschata TaxID=1265417 RepID=A0AAV8YX00_9CUCU|nr:hypothetical protein NQ318_000300 [Aromia moschata]
MERIKEIVFCKKYYVPIIWDQLLALSNHRRTLILISRQTKITTCKWLECKRTAETFGHQNT